MSPSRFDSHEDRVDNRAALRRSVRGTKLFSSRGKVVNIQNRSPPWKKLRLHSFVSVNILPSFSSTSTAISLCVFFQLFSNASSALFSPVFRASVVTMVLQLQYLLGCVCITSTRRRIISHFQYRCIDVRMHLI